MEKLQLNLISNYQNFDKKTFAPKYNFATKKDVFEKSNPVNFTSRHIMDVNLKRRTTKRPLGAQVAQLNFTPEDDKLIFNLGCFWAKTEFIHPITDFYHKKGKKQFYVIAMGNNSEIKAKDVKSILQIEDTTIKNKKVCKVDFVQAAPEIADNEKSSVRGAGEVALYVAVRHAKEEGCKQVVLTSTNNDFYEKIGFEMGAKKDLFSSICPYYLDEKDFDWFLEKTEKKYGFKNV